MWARFGLPQPGHFTTSVTSFNALPAICLCRFFMCDVFFFGTARSIDSQMPDRSPETPAMAAMAGAGRRSATGRSGRCCRRRSSGGSVRDGALAAGMRAASGPAVMERRAAMAAREGGGRGREAGCVQLR